MQRFRYFSLPFQWFWPAVMANCFFFLPVLPVHGGSNSSENILSADINPITASASTTPVTYESYLASFDNPGINFGIYCNGTITITASGGQGPYVYTLEEPFRSQMNGYFTGLAPGNYTIKITDRDGQQMSTTVTVGSSYPQPTLNLSNIVYPSTCTGADGSFTLTASGGTPPYLYSIDGGATFTANGTFTNLIQGHYDFLIVKDANGFLATTGFNSVLVPGDFDCGCCTIILSGLLNDASACTNGGGVLTVDGINAIPVSFSIDNVNYFTGSKKLFGLDGAEYEYAFDNLTYGNIKVYAKDNLGNTAIATFPVVKSCNILINCVSTDASCEHNDGSITVTASNGDPAYTYSLDGIHFQTSNVFSGLATGNYNVLVKDKDQLMNIKPVFVNTGCPLIAATATDGTCGKNGKIVVTADKGTAPYNYSLDGTNFQTSNTFNGLSAGNYTVTLKDANGLINTTQVTIANTDPPQIGSRVISATCKNDGSVSAGATIGAVPMQYSLDSIPFQSDSIFSGLPGGNYTLTVKDINGCPSSQLVTVPTIDNLVADAGNDTTVCEGVLITLNAASNGTSFSWTPTDGLRNPNTLNPKASPAATTTYTLTASEGACLASAAVTIQVKPAPVANAGRDSSICYGLSVQLQGAGGVTYRWTPADFLSNTNISDPEVIKPPHTITYHLIVTDVEGCSSIQDAAVNVRVIPPPQISAGNDTSSAFNQPIQLKVTGAGNSDFIQFNWTPATGLNNPAIPNPVATPSGDMVYTVTATDADGCESTASIHIKLFAGPSIYVPNAFTPNGDGKNDVIKSIPIGIRSFKYFAVYNRWGQRVFYSNDPGKGWDGTLNGMPQPADGYVWTVEGIDNNGKTIHRQGSFLLIR
jgi:gliding motility-associated-like protein